MIHNGAAAKRLMLFLVDSVVEKINYWFREFNTDDEYKATMRNIYYISDKFVD